MQQVTTWWQSNLKARSNKDLPKDAADLALSRLNKLKTSTGSERVQDVANAIRSTMQQYCGVSSACSRTDELLATGVQKELWNWMSVASVFFQR